MIPWFLALLLCVASLAVGMIIAAKSIGSKEEEVLRGAVEATAHAIAALEEVSDFLLHRLLGGIYSGYVELQVQQQRRLRPSQ